jgi:hypothetical protein
MLGGSRYPGTSPLSVPPAQLSHSATFVMTTTTAASYRTEAYTLAAAAGSASASTTATTASSSAAAPQRAVKRAVLLTWHCRRVTCAVCAACSLSAVRRPLLGSSLYARRFDETAVLSYNWRTGWWSVTSNVVVCCVSAGTCCAYRLRVLSLCVYTIAGVA